MEYQLNFEEQKARELLQRITDRLFDDGHIISKPMVKKYAINHCDDMILEIYNCGGEVGGLIQYLTNLKEKIQQL